METVVFMLNDWMGQHLLTTQMKTIPLVGDFLTLSVGYKVMARMFDHNLDCWIIIVIKS